jgi:cell division protein FtsI (penicillin-binding protein 3)
VGLFPADRPQYVVLVKIDSPRHAYYGGEIAAPVTKVVLRAALAARDAALNRAELATVERVRRPTDAVLPVTDDSAGGETNTGNESGSPSEEPATAREPVTIGLPFALRPKVVDQTERPVPDISGLTLREAVKALHRSGFRVRLIPQRGSGTLPAAGTPLAAGSVVKLQHLQ